MFVTSDMWLSRLNSFDKNGLLSQDFLTKVLAVKPSTVKQERARMGRFATEHTENGEQV